MFAIIGSLTFCFYFIYIANIPLAIKKLFNYRGRLKPIDCYICLTVWVAAFLYFYPQLAQFITVAFTTGIIANAYESFRNN